MHGPVCLSIAKLNQLRRQLLDSLSTRLQGRRSLPEDSRASEQASHHSHPSNHSDEAFVPDYRSESPRKARRKPEISAFYYRLPADPAAIACGADVYILPLLALDSARFQEIAAHIRAQEPSARITVHMPPLQSGHPSCLPDDLLAQAGTWPLDGICCAWPAYYDPKGQPSAADPGVLPRRLEIADTTANLFNSRALAYALCHGATTLCPSLELNGAQLREALAGLVIPDSFAPVEIERPLYGRLRLMSSACCPIGHSQPGCRQCVHSERPDDGQSDWLLDRKGQRFLVLPHPRICQAES